MVKTTQPETPVLALGSDTGANADDQVTSNTTPMIIGTAEAGSAVVLKDGLGEILGAATADASGHYSFITPALADGLHSLAVTVTAPGETTSDLSPSLIFTVDTVPPPAPARPRLAAVSDTGQSHSDGLTDRNTLVVVGTYPVAAAGPAGTPQDLRMELLDTDGTVLGTTSVAADGSYRLTTPVLADGPHALTVEAIDDAGNVSQPSAALNVVVETAAATATATVSTTAAVSAVSVSFDVLFDELVGSVAPADFSLVTTGSADGSVETVSGSGGHFVVTVAGLSGTGTVALALKPGAVVDQAGNAVTLADSDSIVVEKTDVPTLALVSTSATGVAGSGALGSPSASGRLVAFNSVGTDLVPGSGADNNDVYVKDMLTGAIVLVSVGIDGPANGQSYGPSLSRSGTIVAFSSDATNLVAGGTPAGQTNVYVATLGSVASAGGLALVPGSLRLVAAGTQPLGVPFLSADGSTVTFDSPSALTFGAETGVENVYSENLTTGLITLVSGGTGTDEYGYGDYTDPLGLVFTGQIIPQPDRAPGTGGDFDSHVTSISGDGNLIAYQSLATDLGGIKVDGDLLLAPPTRSYVYDVATGKTIVLDGNGLLGPATPTDDLSIDDSTETYDPVISADGSEVFFQVEEGSGQTATQYLFQYDVASGATTSVSRVVDGHLEFDSDQSSSRGGGLVAFISNPGVYAATEPYLIGLIDTKTGEISDEGQGFAPRLTEAGNAIVFQSETGDTDQVYELSLGVSAGIDPIAGDDVIDATDLAAAEANGSLAVSGTTNAPAGSSVLLLVYLNRTGLTSPTVFGYVDGAGHWSAALPVADVAGGPGTYVLHMQVGTAAGNSAYTDRPFTVVTQPPSQPAVPVFDPATHVVVAADGTTYTNTATPAFDGATAPYATVSLYIGAAGTTPVAVASTQADENGAYSITAPALVDGSYGVEIQAVDPAGNASPFSLPALFTVDTTPPAALDAPTPVGAQLVAAGTYASADDVLTLTGSGAEPGSTVTLRDIDQDLVLASVPAAADGSYSMTSIPLFDGTYDLMTYATDAAGNVGGSATRIQVTVDTIAPVTPVIDAAVGDVATDGTLSPALLVTGTAEPGSSIALLVDGLADTLDPPVIAGSDGSFGIETLALPAGMHALTVTATDAAGNGSEASLPTTVDISAAPVAPPGGAPLVGDVIDGYISGATVFADANGNGIRDASEVATATGTTGQYTLYNAVGELVAPAGTGVTTGVLAGVLQAGVSGGIDTSTGLSPVVTLTAPAGSTVIDPLTTLLDAYARVVGLTASAAMPGLVAALGLPAGTDLTSLDPVAATLAGNPAAQVAAAKVMDTLTLFDAALSGAGDTVAAGFPAGFSALAAVVAALPPGSTLDLEDRATLASVLAAAAGAATVGADLSDAAGFIAAAGNTALDAAAARGGSGAAVLAAVSQIELTEQGGAASALRDAGRGPADALGAVVATYTGGQLTDVIGASLGLVNGAPALADDTGRSDNDGVIDTTTSTFVGTAAPGTDVAIVEYNTGQVSYTQGTTAATVLGTGVADAQGNYRITTSGLVVVGGSPLDNLVGAIATTAIVGPLTMGQVVDVPNSLPLRAVVVDGTAGTAAPAITDATLAPALGDDATHSALFVFALGTTDAAGTAFADLVAQGGTVTVYADGNPVPVASSDTALIYGNDTGVSISAYPTPVVDSVGFGLTTTPLANGTHVLTATVTLPGGTVLQSAGSYTVTVNAQPVTTGTAIGLGALSGGSVYYAATPSNDSGQTSDTVTDQTGDGGQYSAVLPAGTTGELLFLTGGYDTLTGLPLGGALSQEAQNDLFNASNDSLSALPGSTAISALTTIESYLYQHGNTAAAAARTLAGLGLPAGLNLGTLDPLAQAQAGDTGPLLVLAKLLDTATILSSLTYEYSRTLPKLDFSAIGAYIAAHGSIDLDNPAVLTTALLTYYFPYYTSRNPTPAFLLAAGSIIAASNQAIDAHAAAATSLADILSYTAAAETVAQEATTAAIYAQVLASESTNKALDLTAATAAYTGSNLTDAIAAQLGAGSQATGFTVVGPLVTGAERVSFTLTFAQPVSGLTAADFSVVEGAGLTGAQVLAAVPDAGDEGASYTVTVGTGIGNGSLALAFDGTSIRSASGGPLSEMELTPALTPIGSVSEPRVLASGDFNGDGAPDVVTIGNGSYRFNDNIDVLLNAGGGAFTALAPVSTGLDTTVQDIVVGDFNGDGKADLAVSTNDGTGYRVTALDAVSVLLGNGDGTFRPAITTSIPTEASGTEVTGDFNGDGKLDIAVAGGTDDAGTGNTVTVLLGNGDGSFTVQPGLDAIHQATQTVDESSRVEAADLNGDGHLDLVANDYNGAFDIFLGNGDGTFQPVQSLPTDYEVVNAFTLGDVNGDGIPDLVASPDGQSLAVFLGKGDGTFTALATELLGTLLGGDQRYANAIAIADMNGDGRADLVVSLNDRTAVLYGNGDGTFGTVYQTAQGGNASGQVLALDVNGDGRPDVLNAGEVNVAGGTGGKQVGLEVQLNVPQTVLGSTSQAVTIDRPAQALPALQAAGGTLTVAGQTYTLDLGTLAQGRTASTTLITLLNAATGSADSLDGIFGTPTGTGFTVSGASLPAVLAAGQGYGGLGFTPDTTSTGEHTVTITFAPRDVSSGSGAVIALTDTVDGAATTVTPATSGNDVADELPAMTLIVKDTVIAAASGADQYTLGGTQPGVATTDTTAVAPFAGVTVSNTDPAASGSATVSLSAVANGRLSNPAGGTVSADSGTFTVTGGTAAIQAALRTLVFTPTLHEAPAGQSVGSLLTLTVADSAGAATAGTTVAATATEDAPVITGTQAGQAITDQQTLHPFAAVTITDPDAGASETTTITLAANGTAGVLSGAGLTTAGSGTYTLSAADPATEQAALRALLFTPATGTGTSGSTVTNQFTLAVSDGIDTTRDGATSVIATQTSTGTTMGDVHMVTLDGLHYDFQADGEFTLVRSTVPGNPFDIQIRTEAWTAYDLTSLTTEAAAQVGDSVVDFALDGSVRVNGLRDTALDAAHPVQQIAGGTLTALGNGGYQLDWVGGEGLTVVNEGFFLNLHTTAASDGPGSVEGLLGTLRGQANDLALPDGTVLAQPVPDATLLGTFAQAWAVGSSSMLDGGTIAIPAAVLGLPDTPTFVTANAPGEVLTGSQGSRDPVIITGTLSNLNGAVLAGFTSRDALDLVGTMPTETDLTFSNTGATLTITDVTGTAKLTLDGFPSPALQTLSDLHGGTLIRFQ